MRGEDGRKGKGRERIGGKGREEKRGRGGEGKGPRPLTQIPGSSPGQTNQCRNTQCSKVYQGDCVFNRRVHAFLSVTFSGPVSRQAQLSQRDRATLRVCQ